MTSKEVKRIKAAVEELVEITRTIVDAFFGNAEGKPKDLYADGYAAILALTRAQELLKRYEFSLELREGEKDHDD